MQDVRDEERGNNPCTLNAVELVQAQKLRVNHDGAGRGIAVILLGFYKALRRHVAVAVDE